MTNRIPRPGEPNIGFDPGAGPVGGLGTMVNPPVAPPPVSDPTVITPAPNYPNAPVPGPIAEARSSSIRWVGAAIGITLFLIVGLVVAIIVVNQQPTKSKRRPRRRRIDDDDY